MNTNIYHSLFYVITGIFLALAISILMNSKTNRRKYVYPKSNAFLLLFSIFFFVLNKHRNKAFYVFIHINNATKLPEIKFLKENEEE